MLEVLEAERGRGFNGLAGSRIAATVPLRQAWLDAALARVRAWPSALESLAVEIGEANRLHLTAVVRVLGFRTPVRLQLRLAPTMEDGIVRLVIDDGSMMASAVALLGPLLGQMPEGIVLRGRDLQIDVRRLAAQQGVGDLASMVSTVTFDSSRGVLWVAIHAAAPASEPADPRGRARATQGTALPFDLAEVRAWLQGARVDVDVQMDERLANDLLAALHAEARTPTGDALRDTVAHALQRPVVRFGEGVLRLSATAALDPPDPSAS